MEQNIQNITIDPQTLVANSTDLEKGEFYRHTYLHLASAVIAFIFVETMLLKFLPSNFIMGMMGSRAIWLFIIGLFWLGSLVSNKLAASADRSMQYVGLAVYILIEAFIFLPLIYIGLNMGGEGLIQQSAIITGTLFLALTYIGFTTKKDLTFLRSFLVIGGAIALGLIVAGTIFGFGLGLWFSVAMVGLAAGSILYQTQSLQYSYRPDQYVAASIGLFASVMLLFWYVLSILMRKK